MYDPTTGRWTSEDSDGFDAGDANLDRYVGNSPTNATDPSGLRVYARSKDAAINVQKWLAGEDSDIGRGFPVRIATIVVQVAPDCYLITPLDWVGEVLPALGRTEDPWERAVLGALGNPGKDQLVYWQRDDEKGPFRDPDGSRWQFNRVDLPTPSPFHGTDFMTRTAVAQAVEQELDLDSRSYRLAKIYAAIDAKPDGSLTPAEQMYVARREQLAKDLNAAFEAREGRRLAAKWREQGVPVLSAATPEDLKRWEYQDELARRLDGVKDPQFRALIETEVRRKHYGMEPFSWSAFANGMLGPDGAVWETLVMVGGRPEQPGMPVAPRGRTVQWGQRTVVKAPLDPVPQGRVPGAPGNGGFRVQIRPGSQQPELVDPQGKIIAQSRLPEVVSKTGQPRVPGRPLTPAELNDIRNMLDGMNVDLVENSKSIKFTAQSMGRHKFHLAPNPTEYEYWHERFHLEHLKGVGYADFSRTSEKLREQYVYDQLRLSPIWNKMRQDERDSAFNYILNVGGNPMSTPNPNFPAPDLP